MGLRPACDAVMVSVCPHGCVLSFVIVDTGPGLVQNCLQGTSWVAGSLGAPGAGGGVGWWMATSCPSLVHSVPASCYVQPAECTCFQKKHYFVT